MNSLAALLVPALLLVAPANPTSDQDGSRDESDATAGLMPAPESDDADEMPSRAVAPVWRDLTSSFQAPTQNQVRIQQRVIIRIAPRQPTMPSDMLSALPQGEITPHYEERKFGKCVPVKGIAGVQVNGSNRLLLFLRDRRILSATLDKSCRARDFYSGFYIEPNEDGLLCSGRDQLHSRAGTNCNLGKLRRLILVGR